MYVRPKIKSEIITAKILVKTCNNGKIPVRILNLFNNEKLNN